MNDFVLITLYVDSRQDENWNEIEDGEENSAIQRELYGTNAQPLFVKLSPQGEQIGEPIGYTVDVERFLQWLE